MIRTERPCSGTDSCTEYSAMEDRAQLGLRSRSLRPERWLTQRLMPARVMILLLSSEVLVGSFSTSDKLFSTSDKFSSGAHRGLSKTVPCGPRRQRLESTCHVVVKNQCGQGKPFHYFLITFMPHPKEVSQLAHNHAILVFIHVQESRGRPRRIRGLGIQ